MFVVLVCPGRAIRAFACRNISVEVVGDAQMIVVAAVSVSPWAIVSG